MKRLLIGLSLEGCVVDIVRGAVGLDEIIAIIANTSCDCPDDWNFVFRRYCLHDWRGNPEKATAIAKQLVKEGRVVQPQRYGMPHHQYSKQVRWIPLPPAV